MRQPAAYRAWLRGVRLTRLASTQSLSNSQGGSHAESQVRPAVVISTLQGLVPRFGFPSPRFAPLQAATNVLSRFAQLAALQLLKKDHARVKSMFTKFGRRISFGEQELAATICNELKLHAALEEQVFYPAVREAIADPEIMNEADVEHASAKELDRADRGLESLGRALRCLR